MARIRKRRRADGGIRYQVRWVLGGGAAGPGQTELAETFTSRSRALVFAAEVEDAGHQWPTNAEGVRWLKGHGYVEPVVDGSVTPSTVHDVAVSYFEHQARMAKLGHLKPYTLHRYRRSYELHLSTMFGPMIFADVQPSTSRTGWSSNATCPRPARASATGTDCSSRSCCTARSASGCDPTTPPS